MWRKITSLFLVVQFILATISFSFIVGAQTPNPCEVAVGGCPIGVSPSPEVAVPVVIVPPVALPPPQIPDGGIPPQLENQRTDKLKNLFNKDNLNSAITYGGVGGIIFTAIGTLAGGENGALWGGIAGGVGGAVAGLLESSLGTGKSILAGLGVAGVIFILTYKKASEETV